ncbi:MAG: hypothetical protein ABR506_01640 [Candidatus Krumholzibacteriia bacterium]
MRAGGLLPVEQAARIDAHVAECPLCRLEMARATRFQVLDHDDETAAEAGWHRAAPRLDAAWRTAIRPALASRRRRTARWLVPAAVAASLALVALNAGDRSSWPVGPQAADTVRGGPTAAPAIRPLQPTGDRDDPPGSFTWAADRPFDTFVLEVFTAELGTVLRLESLGDPPVDLPDSLRARFARGVTYFWHVEGKRGLAASDMSPTVSFRILAAAE